MPAQLRIGCVPFLNSKVLIHGLAPESTETEHVLSFAPPGQLAQQLAAGEIDVGLIPAVEYFRIPELVILPGLAVAAHGPVDSVKLFSRAPEKKIRRVALDTGSRSSVALLKILFAERLGFQPDYVDLDSQPEPRAPEANSSDAFLLIGDPCLSYQAADGLLAFDLASLWLELTSLPFVFAVWAGRREANLGQAFELLRAAKAAGQASAESIARAAAPTLGIDESRAIAYVTKRIGYDLGPQEIRGLEAFYEYAVKHDLAPEGRGLAFYND